MISIWATVVLIVFSMASVSVLFYLGFRIGLNERQEIEQRAEKRREPKAYD